MRTVAVATVTAVVTGVTALLVPAAPAGAVPGTVATATATAAVPVITWGQCRPAVAPLQCARVQVPLDHDRPTGARISLALIRYPATDRAHRIGSLFLNPGGPGGSGVDLVLGAGELFAQQLRGRYDVVGFDPRGIGRSTPLVCLTDPAQVDRVTAPWPFPLTRAQERQQRGYDTRLAAFCAQHGGAIIDHMSTADVARDLDLLRAAVGDPRLNYLGYSYGTQLGSVYANLFPRRVGRVVLDGVLDPVAWTTGTPATARLPFSTRLHSDKGAQATFDQFLARCDRAATDRDAATVCAFGPRSKARFDRLAVRLKASPPDPGSGLPTYQDVIGSALGALYAADAWPALGDFLAAVEKPNAPAVAAARAALTRALGLAGPGTATMPQTVEGFVGVACSDSRNPASYAAWPTAGAQADAESGYFGRLWTWASSPCQPWPGQGDDRYLGPWTAPTANPVLVVGNRFDPATRYQGAVTVSRLLPRSRLLTYEGWGHTAYLSAGSSCTDAAVTAYLLRGTLPAVGTSCPVEVDPFRQVPSAARVGRSAAAVSPALPVAVRRALGG